MSRASLIRALYFYKRALYVRQRALCICKRAICQPNISTDTELLCKYSTCRYRDLLRVCHLHISCTNDRSLLQTSPIKDDYILQKRPIILRSLLSLVYLVHPLHCRKRATYIRQKALYLHKSISTKDI